MRKAIIILSIILGITVIINVIFVLYNRPTLQNLAAPTSPLSSIPDNPTQEDIDAIIAALEKDSSPQSPTVPTFTIPAGFRFPENANLTERTSLEIVLPSLISNQQTGRMDELEKDLLLSRLGRNYYYDPVSQNIVADSSYQAHASIIDFGIFDPATLEIKKDENMLWFNQNTSSCQLRTDPKSPERINQTITSQKSIMIQLTTPGIYFFYCQDKPENTQTIVVI